MVYLPLTESNRPTSRSLLPTQEWDPDPTGTGRRGQSRVRNRGETRVVIVPQELRSPVKTLCGTRWQLDPGNMTVPCTSHPVPSSESLVEEAGESPFTPLALGLQSTERVSRCHSITVLHSCEQVRNETLRVKKNSHTHIHLLPSVPSRISNI